MIHISRLSACIYVRDCSQSWYQACVHVSPGVRNFHMHIGVPSSGSEPVDLTHWRFQTDGKEPHLISQMRWEMPSSHVWEAEAWGDLSGPLQPQKDLGRCWKGTSFLWWKLKVLFFTPVAEHLRTQPEGASGCVWWSFDGPSLQIPFSPGFSIWGRSGNADPMDTVVQLYAHKSKCP